MNRSRSNAHRGRSGSGATGQKRSAPASRPVRRVGNRAWPFGFRGKTLILGLALLAACTSVPDGPAVEVGVPPGSSVASVAESLTTRGVIANPRWFRLLARLKGTHRHIQPGLYEFRPGAGEGPILDQLAAGKSVRIQVTLPEGGTVWDLARNTERRLGIPRDSILVEVRDSALLREFGIPGGTVEGWLRPETFDFGGYDSARDVVRRFLVERRDHWPEDWRQRADAADLDRAEVLSLASIVEAEAFLPEEMPRIAAVYRNRLRLGMPLQADPTIQYAFLLDRGERKPRLFNRDYAYQSPYNTYLHPGLPPTPIGNPSDAAIEAVLSPADVKDLYFVAKGDGSHVFAKSYQEHLRNIRRVRR